LAAAEPCENAEHYVDYNSDRHRHYVMISVSTSSARLVHTDVGMD